MQSIIVSSKSKKINEEYVIKICKDNKIDEFEINVIEEEKSIGIDDIRNFQKKVFLKPQRSKIKASIIKNAENLTIEAQNALLKLLEEPPTDTVIILTTSNKDSLLPTIRSRCKIISLKEEGDQLSEKEVSDYLDLLESLSAGKIGERLKLAESAAKTKEDALLWLEKMILAIRHPLVDSFSNDKLSISKLLNYLITLQKTHTILSTTNANPRLTLENLFLNL